MRPVEATGYILTGGRSSRFGSDKALHPVRGRPMALRVADALSLCARPVIVVGKPSVHGPLGLPVIEDRIAGFGPLGGIVSALGHASTGWILVAACDMPWLTTEPLRQLLAAAGRTRAMAVLPRTPDGRLQPLCAAYAKAGHGPLATALLAGTLKVTDALRNLDWETLDVPSNRPFANINRRADLAEARASGPVSRPVPPRAGRGRCDS